MSNIRKVGNKLKNLWKEIGETGYILKSKAKKNAYQLLSRYSKTPIGIVELDIIDITTGKRVGGFCDTNVIVDLARGNMSRLVVDDTNGANERFWEEIRFGDGGHNPTTLEPLTPTVGDTDLGGTLIITKTISSGDVAVSFPNSTTVKFVLSILANEGNGTGFQTYSELGIHTKAGVIQSRKTFAAVSKSQDLRLNFTYSVLF